ncbi:quinone oxidoreductase family protein [Microbacterium sp.]|uniref:quinone oxidoreductase family protein n=1 Tax=Microbacterium sp. TaxID=51671 RepID=UPI003C725A45
MKAIQITSYDGPEGLSYNEIPAPEPRPDQVAIDVEYAGANYVEALFAGGFVPNPLPWVPGIEAAGHIRSVGNDATGFTVGDPVAALTINGGGGYGQVAVTHAGLVAPLPPGMDPALAAVVPSNTTTALIVLERIAHLAAGEHVLVHAAAGGLGSQFGQIARLLGAQRVVGVVGSDSKRQAALDLGYDEVWLRADLENASPRQFDVIADPVSGPDRITSLGLLRLGGRLLAIGDAAQAGDQPISSNTLWFNGIGVHGFNLGALSAAEPQLVGTYLRRALTLVAAGDVTVHVAEQAPIQDAPRVLTALRDGHTVGKTIFIHETASARKE